MVQPGLTSLERNVISRINADSWFDLVRELIPAGQPAAENPLDPDMPSGKEQAIATVVAAKLQAMGLSVRLAAKQQGRPNVIGRLQGTSSEKTLIVNDHLDTYPAGDPSRWTMTGGNPYNPTIHGDRLYSRGTSDTRGNLACTLVAVKAIQDAGIKLKGDLLCVYTVDEEKHGTNGAIYLLEELGIKADFEITAEPTAWTAPTGRWGISIAVAHCGNCLVELQTSGLKSHIWRPDSGVNAISSMVRLISALEKIKFSHIAPGIYGSNPPAACLVRIKGGVAGEMQFTADSCTAVCAVVGIVPGMTAQSVLRDIEALISQLKSADTNFSASARLFNNSLFVPATEELTIDDQPVKSVVTAYQKILAETPLLYRKNAYCDTIRFSQQGIASITFGPGEDGWPPINEYIHTAKILAASQIYALTIMDLLGVAT
ncbi:MAG: M20/M25/M40 family metallo-hydrolase [Gammaproteobacteria bacterium]|nr:M20/M25/M40 family metallo-hydrolase [Gammaproteobacteria bacterium]